VKLNQSHSNTDELSLGIIIALAAHSPTALWVDANGCFKKHFKFIGLTAGPI
jgi:hypothetical protein